MSARKHIASEIWKPPNGWTQTGAGVWVPGGYKPTRWELDAPRIHNVNEGRADWAKCAKSLGYFAFAHSWTIDVDDPQGASQRKIPAYPFLRSFFNDVQTPQNTHCEKSRQMMMSWAWMVVFAWDIIFHRNWQSLVLSKRAKDVDDGPPTINSNFGKLVHILNHLPEHIYVQYIHKAYQLRVPATNSTVIGETGKGGMASRGPTWNRALMDEAAYIQHSETVFAGLRQAAKRGTCLNSTPNGKGNTFARIRFSTTTSFKKLSYHWSQHPRKAAGLYCVCGWKAEIGIGKPGREQWFEHARECPRLETGGKPKMRSPWYDREAGDLPPDKVASELDISYEGSRAGRVYTAFDQEFNVWPIYDRLGPRYLDEEEEEYRLRYLALAIDPALELFASIDIGVGDPTALLFGQIVNHTEPRVRFLDEFEKSDEAFDTYVSVVKYWQAIADSVGSPFTIRIFGGEDVKNRDSKLESWFSNFRAQGLIIERSPGIGGLLEWCDYINDQYRHGRIEISEWCAGIIDATENYHFPTDENGVPLPGRHLPVHDEWSHKMDSKRYLYTNLFISKLYDRDSKGVSSKQMVKRSGAHKTGAVYDRKNEGRIF